VKYIKPVYSLSDPLIEPHVNSVLKTIGCSDGRLLKEMEDRYNKVGNSDMFYYIHLEPSSGNASTNYASDGVTGIVLLPESEIKIITISGPGICPDTVKYSWRSPGGLKKEFESWQIMHIKNTKHINSNYLCSRIDNVVQLHLYSVLPTYLSSVGRVSLDFELVKTVNDGKRSLFSDMERPVIGDIFER